MTRTWLWLGAMAALGTMASGRLASAQEPPSRPPVESKPAASGEAEKKPGSELPSPQDRQIRELMQRLEKVEAQLGKLNAARGQLPAEKKDQKLHTLLEIPYLGTHFYGGPNGRYFAARLIFINLTPQAISIKKDQFRIEVDGAEQPIKDVPANLQYVGFQAGSENFQLRNLKTPDELKIPAGGTATTWVVSTEIPGGNQVPKLVVKATAGEHKVEIDVNQQALATLGLDVERIGPRESLGLLTIHGSLNTINLGSFVDALDRLAAAKVARAVVRWADGAGPVEGQLLSWLVQSAQMAGRGEVQNQQFPSLPASVRELHLARIPNTDANNYNQQPGMPVRVHKTDAEAVAAALESAYEVLPLDELVTEIEKGHALTRSAALAGGGGRLPADKLPLILKYAADPSPAMQRSALIALRHFGEPEAVKTLEQTALKNAEPSASAALESLAASRFPTAHEALLKILKNEPAASRKKIVGVLARYPRPIWSESVYAFVEDPNSGLGAEGLRALSLVGHPKMIEVFEKALGQKNADVRNEAFNILSTRTDAQSEELAMKFTLAHLKDTAPTPQMINLLNRTKDPRAVDPLLELFDKQPNNRSMLINTLAQIGDQKVSDRFIQEYPKLRNYEQAAVLNALIQLRSPGFRKLAGQAIASNDASLVSAACQGLQNDGSPEAVRMLIDAFEKTSNTNTWSYTSNALSMVGTPDARETLLKARASNDQNKRNMANNALRNLWQRSPGYQYIFQAQQSAQAEKWKEAVQHFSMAIEIDPDLPDAWSGRANAHLKQNKTKEAKTDYTKAFELDPYNSNAITGLSLLTVLEGDYEAGIKKVEEARGKFTNDVLFAYNTACVYSQATAAAAKDEKAADREKKVEEYRKKAFEELKRSVQLGFQDFEWMKKDPDFAPIRETPEFEEIAKPAAPGAAPAGGPRRVRIPKL